MPHKKTKIKNKRDSPLLAGGEALRSREKRASALKRQGKTVKEGQEQADKEVAASEARAEANTPEAQAQRQLQVEAIKNRLINERIGLVSDLPTEKPRIPLEGDTGDENPDLLGAGGTVSAITPSDVTAVAGGASAVLGRAAIQPALISISRTAGGALGKTPLVVQRSFIGKGGKTQVDKIFKSLGSRAKTAIRFKANPKSEGLTKSWLIKFGIGLAVASNVVDIIGTYPFAGFIKEESLQQLGFATNDAKKSNDPDRLESVILAKEGLVEANSTIVDKIPYANVQKQLINFNEAVKETLKGDKKDLERMRAKSTFERGE